MNGRRIGAFSLIELLVVIAIIAILSALVIPSISTLRGLKLTNAGQKVADEMAFAHQAALAKSCTVEVRIYKLPDFADPTNGTPSVFRAMQCFSIQRGETNALNRPVYFDAPVVITSDNSQSPMVASTNRLEQSPIPSDASLGSYGKNYKYRSFQFFPSGATDLDIAENFVTLIFENGKSLSAGGNFYTVQIDPVNGDVRTFRP